VTDHIVEFVLDESKWLAAAMLLSMISVAVWVRRQRRERALDRRTILGALNRFYGGMIGIMAFGHLLAVALTSLRGTLKGSPWALYPLGVVLAVPAWWLYFGVERLAAGEERWSRRTALLNSFLGITLLALGLHNFPLAAPAALNLAYQFHTRRAVGWMILTVAIAAILALFAGSLVFLASGQSFEQFSDM
jgi:hypothetical protein